MTGDAHGKEPEFIFKTVHIFKAIQVVAFTIWYYSHFGTEMIELPSLSVCAVSLLLLAVGQTLNMLVWYRIGVQGVVSFFFPKMCIKSECVFFSSSND